MVESPQGPESYAHEEECEKKRPSFWAFPEWEALAALKQEEVGDPIALALPRNSA